MSVPLSTELRASEERSQRRLPWRAAAAIAAIAAIVVAVVVLVLPGWGSDGPLVVTVPGHPTDLVVTPDAVWVSAATSGSVWALDPASGHRLNPSLRTGGTPARLAAGANSLWVVDTAAASVIPVRVRRQRGSLDATPYEAIPTGADATDAAVAGGVLWVLDSAEGVVRAIEPGGRPVRSLRVGNDPVDLAAGGRWVVAAAPGSGTLARIDTQTRRLAPPIEIGGVPSAVAVTGTTAWAVDTSAGTVVPVNLDNGERGSAIRVGKRPVAVAADGDDVYVLCRADWTLVHVDGATGKVLARDAVGADAVAVALDRRHVWVAGGEENQVLRFDR